MSIYNKKKRSKKERIGFYTSLSICIVAVGMAAYSTYTSLTGYMNSDNNQAKPVNQVVTGVTDKVSTLDEAVETTEETTVAETTEPETYEATESTEGTKSSLQTMLTVNTSLSFPLDKGNILQQYSEETVYNKTLNQWEAHTGVDFKCSEGDNVYSMGDGQVTKIYKDDLLGKTVVVKSSTYTAYYSGLKDSVNVSKGNSLKVGDVIGTADNVPSEAMEGRHIHVAIKVGNQFVDPLSLINNDE